MKPWVTKKLRAMIPFHRKAHLKKARQKTALRKVRGGWGEDGEDAVDAQGQKRQRVSHEEKLRYIQLYESQGGSMRAFCRKDGLGKRDIQKWLKEKQKLQEGQTSARGSRQTSAAKPTTPQKWSK